MRYDELAFVNLQLAGMLKSGVPLEGALRQLSTTMQRGQFRDNLQLLESRLAAGAPLKEALAESGLPDLYCRMLLVGAQGNDLPGVLTLMADYYQRIGSVGARLKGLMVYPMIVVFASLALSIFLAVFFNSLSEEMPKILSELGPDLVFGTGVRMLIWLPVLLLGSVALGALAVLLLPWLRRWGRWHLPGMRDAALAQLASAMRLMLHGGANLTDALALLGHLETGSPAARDVALWQKRLAAGHGRFAELAEGSRVVPPLFAWLVNSAEEDLALGFQRAAEIYEARAAYRVDMMLYAALPVSVLFLGVMLVSQAYPVIRIFVQFGTLIDRLGQ